MGGFWTKHVRGICIETKMCHFVTEKLDGDYFTQNKKGKWKHVVQIVIFFVTYMTISRCKKFNYFAKKQIFAILQADQKIFGPNIRLFL